MPDIIHFTTVHTRWDTRIAYKEVASLSKMLDQSVALFVQDGKGDETDDELGFTIHDTGSPFQNRLARMVFGGWRMYRAVLREKPKIAHFHDPELMPFAALLRFHGIKVVYDAHENIELQVHHKPYLPNFIKGPLGWLMGRCESAFMRWFDANIAVLEDLLKNRPGKNKVTITNFPDLSEFDGLKQRSRSGVAERFVYAGGITRARGGLDMIAAMEFVQEPEARLVLLGVFDNPELEKTAREAPGWRKVNYLGWSDRETVVSELSCAKAGLALLHPTPQYISWYPVKMFEYMAAGLPVIASNFPLWVELFSQYKCGINVDPSDPEEIARAIDWVMSNEEEAEAMGRRGRSAVQDAFNWQHEARKLVGLYEKLLS